jgi:hypothetical protein
MPKLLGTTLQRRSLLVLLHLLLILDPTKYQRALRISLWANSRRNECAPTPHYPCATPACTTALHHNIIIALASI